ncbi:MAG TPA: glycosyltransferase family A protein [Chthoniobacteraceae bacterium]|jgi:hypothetical protein|nr:glycosyltransferase family A protein [Chthoniobacteraceae bacterium]
MADELKTPPWLEIVIPVRNPGAPFLRTIASLEAQSERGFGVVLSDNHSTAGEEIIREARERLEAAGIPVRAVCPPTELSRVEHWNWAHHAAHADWLKPLFVGDTLEPAYVAAVRARVAQAPAAQVVRCDFDFLIQGTRQPAARAPAGHASLTPAEFLRYFPERGNWLGGPINFAYTRLAWLSAGGYAVHLPACADLDLYVALVLRHGLELVEESLAVFELHGERFSMGIRRRHVIGVVELWLILRQARNYCEAVALPWPRHGVAAGVFVQVMNDYVRPWKARLRARLGL